MVKCITSGLLYNPLRNDTVQQQLGLDHDHDHHYNHHNHHQHLANLKTGKVQQLQQHPLQKRDVLPAGFQEPE